MLFPFTRRLFRNPAFLAVLGACCLQRPAAGVALPPHQFLLLVFDGFGCLALAVCEHLLRNPEGD